MIFELSLEYDYIMPESVDTSNNGSVTDHQEGHSKFPSSMAIKICGASDKTM